MQYSTSNEPDTLFCLSIDLASIFKLILESEILTTSTFDPKTLTKFPSPSLKTTFTSLYVPTLPSTNKETSNL